LFHLGPLCQGLDIINNATLFACAALTAKQSTARSVRAAAAFASVANAQVPANELDPAFDQAFNLSSRPSSAKKIW
jgi:hypothetical protein